MYRTVSEAVNYLKNIDIAKQEIGKQYVVNDHFYYFVQEYKTKSALECKLESHRNYIDIQMLCSGRELVEVVDISRLDSVEQEYDAQRDVIFWKAPERTAQVLLQSGDYIILYPENAHRASVYVDVPEKVIKIVGKLKVK